MLEFFHRRGRSVTYLILMDYLVLVSSFILGLFLRRYDPGRDLINLRMGAVVPEIVFILGYGPLLLLVFGALGLYQRKVWLSRMWHVVSVTKAAAVSVGGYFLLLGMFKDWYLVPSRYVLLIWAASFLAGLLAHRLLLFPFLVRLATRSGFQRRVVVIGSGAVALDFIRRWREKAGDSTLQIIGYLSDIQGPETEIQGIPKLGDIPSLPGLVSRERVEGAIIVDPDLSYEDLLLRIDECIRLFGWVDVHSVKSAIWHSGEQADFYFDIPFVRMSGAPQTPLYLACKRLFDLAAAALALLLLSPLLIGVILTVRTTSPGPVFHIRPRIGRNGKPFPFYKFRSMRVGAEQDAARRAAILELMAKPDQVSRKVVNPDLVTPVGAFIRKWAIDETPQLWNVLRGDMSLVGPRPLPPEEYEAQSEWQKKRFDLQPGRTGLWKIYAVRSGISFTDTALYDLYYGRNMNPLLDLSILLQTAWVIAVGRADT